MCNGLYTKLKIRLFEKQMRQEDLARAINKPLPYISRRMTGKYEWHLNIVYDVCNVLDIPLSEIPEYFPPGGKA